MAKPAGGNVIRWLQHVDLAILVIAAVSGIFLGLADVLFDLPKLQSKQLGLAVVLLGAVALHAIFQRVASYQTQATIDLLRAKTEDLVSLDKARRNFVRAMGNFIEVQDLKFRLHHTNPAFGVVADRLLAPSFRVLEALTAGHVNVPENLVTSAFAIMVESYDNRFDAVSNDDIDFWHDNKNIAPRYLGRNIEAIRRGLVVTRLFVVPQRQICDEGERHRLTAVLSQQALVGIGWALAIYEDFEPNLPPGPLDFTLFDTDRAMSTFRREGERRFIAVFNTNGLISTNDERIAEQAKLYEALLTEIWMASDTFVQSFLGNNEQMLTRLRMETDLYNRRLYEAVGKVAEHQVFPYLVSKQQDLAERLAELARTYQDYQKYQAQRRP